MKVHPVNLHAHLASSTRWRDQYNPLRGLTLERAVTVLEAGERGEYADLQWLYRAIERRDPTLSALLTRYDGGLLKLDWQIREASTDLRVHHHLLAHAVRSVDSGLAREQALALNEAYSRIDNLREAIQFLVLSRFRGFAHLEKWCDSEGQPIHLEPVPQWHWVRAGLNGAWEYNREARGGIRRGERIDPYRFVVRETDRPIDEIGLFVHIRRNLCQKDWDAFVETYGVPAMFLVGPPGASQEAEEELAARMEGVLGNTRGYLPNGTQLITVPVDSRGINPFRTYLKSLDESLVLAATGGKLSVLAEPGVGQQAGLVHWQAWGEILQGEAQMLSEILQRQLDAAILERHFPGRPIQAWFQLCASQETEVSTVVQHATQLAAAGYRVEPTQLSERTGYTLDYFTKR